MAQQPHHAALRQPSGRNPQRLAVRPQGPLSGEQVSWRASEQLSGGLDGSLFSSVLVFTLFPPLPASQPQTERALEAGVPARLVAAFENAAGFPATWEALIAAHEQENTPAPGPVAAVSAAAATVEAAAERVEQSPAPNADGGAGTVPSTESQPHVTGAAAASAVDPAAAVETSARAPAATVDNATETATGLHSPRAADDTKVTAPAADQPVPTSESATAASQPTRSTATDDASSCSALDASTDLNGAPTAAPVAAEAQRSTSPSSPPQPTAPAAASCDARPSPKPTTAATSLPAPATETEHDAPSSPLPRPDPARPSSARASLATPKDASRAHRLQRRRVQTDSAGKRKRVRVVRRGAIASQKAGRHMTQSAPQSRDASASPLLDTSSLSALPRSRSGRSIKPPLSYWANQVRRPGRDMPCRKNAPAPRP